MTSSSTPAWLERLYEKKPVPLIEHLCEAAAEHIAESLLRWPPEVEWQPSTSGAAQSDSNPFEMALTGRPSRALLEQSFQVAAWDLLRQFEAIDDYFRNHRFEAAGLTNPDAAGIRFLSRLCLEHLFALQDATAGRLNRTHLMHTLDLTKQRVMRSIAEP